MVFRDDSDNEHVYAHQERPSEKRALATDPLNQKDDEKCTSYNLGESEEPAEEEGVVATTYGRKNLGRNYSMLVTDAR